MDADAKAAGKVIVISPGVLEAGPVLDRNGNLRPISRNVRLFLEHDPKLIGLVALDDFSGKRMLMRVPPWESGNDWQPRPWQDRDTAELMDWLQNQGLPRITKAATEDGLLVTAGRNRFHPVQNYLQALQWDGQERLHLLMRDYFGAEASEYIEAVGRLFLVSAVARAMRPGCKADHVIVLEGRQGAGKSQSLLRLSPNPEWVLEHLPDFHSRDAEAMLRGRWLIEVAELTAIRRSDLESMKSFLSRQVDVFRPAYGRHEIQSKRSCVFVFTTNETHYLMDPTGNRRFWPIRTGAIDLAAIERDRDQLWAEAMARFRDGEAWHIADKKVLAAVTVEQAARQIDDPWLGIISTHVQHLDSTDNQMLMEVLEIPKERQAGGHMKRVHSIMRELGFGSRRDQSGGKDLTIFERKSQ